MKNFLFLSLFVISSFVLQAQIQGPLSGRSFTTTVIPGSNQTWSNQGNTSASDDVYSTFGNITGGVGSYTNYLVATNFGFTIPVAATITGIVVEVERSDPNLCTADYSVRIVKGSSIGSEIGPSERAVGSGYSSSDSYQSYGNAGDLWGEIWSPIDINEPTFGVAIAAKRTVISGTTGGRIDNIRIIVFYSYMILPVKLINFSAYKKDNSVNITWITSEETNMGYYEAERSTNARDFITINSIESLNQNKEIKYTVIDTNPANGISYYRLKTVENNGVIKYSKIISFQFSTGSTVTLYPTVWESGTTLNITNPEYEKLTIYFFNTSGKLAGKAVTNSKDVSTGMILKEKGILFFRITNEAGKICGSGKLVVN